jgi:hypothetical protein
MRDRKKLPSKTAGKKSDSVTEPASIEQGGDNASPTISPLDYMLSVMRDPQVAPARRDAMAKIALRYLHPKPRATAQVRKDERPVELSEISETEVARRIGFILARAARTKAGKS